MKKYFLAALFSFFVSAAQLDQYQVYVGLVGFEKDLAYDVRGIDKNAFAGFKDSPLLGAGFSMYLSDHLRIGANIEGTSTSKSNYAMSFVTINPNLNFHILPFNKVISPFISINGSLAILNLKQDPYTYIARPQTGYSKPSATNPLIVEEEISRPYFSLQSQPMLGGGFGVGVDIKLKKHWGIIGSFNYNALLDESNAVINKNLTNNQYNLAYASLNVMLRYRLF